MMVEKKKKKPKDNGTVARPMVFYKNFDYVDNDPNGPGEGLYHGKMDKYKSVDEFRKKKRKRLQKIRGFIIDYLLKQAEKKDKNNLVDPTEGIITSIPLAPQDVNPLGLMDGVWPLADSQEFSKGNLYYGELDGAHADDGKNEEDNE
jgi:hypothetical protein